MSGAPPFHAMPADLWASMVDGFETAWSGPWTDAMCISDMRYWASRAKNGHDERCPTRRVMQQRWQRSRYHTERIRRDVALWADPHCAVTEDFFSPAPKSDVATFKTPAPAAPPVVKPEVVIEEGRIRLKVVDHILGRPIIIPADQLILASAIIPRRDEALAQAYKVTLDSDGWFLEAHQKLRPVEFATDGVFLAGLCHYPKPLVEAIASYYRAHGARYQRIVFGFKGPKNIGLVSEPPTQV